MVYSVARMRIKLNELPRMVYEKLSLTLTLAEIRRGVSCPPTAARPVRLANTTTENKHFNL